MASLKAVQVCLLISCSTVCCLGKLTYPFTKRLSSIAAWMTTALVAIHCYAHQMVTSLSRLFSSTFSPTIILATRCFWIVVSSHGCNIDSCKACLRNFAWDSCSNTRIDTRRSWSASFRLMSPKKVHGAAGFGPLRIRERDMKKVWCRRIVLVQDMIDQTNRVVYLKACVSMAG